MKQMICNNCGYEWNGDEGHCPKCDSLETQVVEGE